MWGARPCVHMFGSVVEGPAAILYLGDKSGLAPYQDSTFGWALYLPPQRIFNQLRHNVSSCSLIVISCRPPKTHTEHQKEIQGPHLRFEPEVPVTLVPAGAHNIPPRFGLNVQDLPISCFTCCGRSRFPRGTDDARDEAIVATIMLRAGSG